MSENKEKFLRKIARRYLELSEEGNDSVCLVFPNRRAAVFFRKELISLNPKNQWAPEIFSADDFVREVIRKPILDPIARLFEFYNVYVKSEGPEAEPFDTYLTWAPQLLHDYEETDLYSVDARKLYGSVDAAYAMKNWSPDGKIITATQEQYIRFWSRMGEWYQLFRYHLESKKMVSPGMAYRELAANIETLQDQLPWKHIVFAGFNALNASEQRYMRFLEKSGKAEIIWDTDPYYLNDPLNEAGYFFRKYRNELGIGKFNFSEAMLNDPKQEINIVGVAKNMGQALVAGSVLKNLINSGHDLTDTAIVLCDEKLMMPVLEMLPEEVEAVNITMGYPLHQLPMSGMFQILFDMHRKARNSSSGKGAAFYFRDLQKLFRQPDIRTILGQADSTALLNLVNSEKFIYLSSKTLIERAPSLNKISFLFESWNEDVDTAINRLLELVKILFEFYKEESREIGYHLETLHTLKSLLIRIQKWNQDYPGYASLRTLQKIFAQLLRQKTLPFYGEPLQGLQLMGLLETRNLDFKQLILLSVNETIMPAARVQKSFIPTDIATHFGLPTYKERDAIYGYHFYRMLQRAEKVWLIYNTENDEFGKGEQSRFITQILKEFDQPKIQTSVVVPELPSPTDYPIVIEKTDEVLQKIIDRYNGSEPWKQLSPSAMQKFVSCGLKYYLSYFTGIKIQDDREDDLESNQLGTISHKVLEDLFKPHLDKVLRPEAYAKMLQDMPSLLRKEFLEIMEASDLEKGNNLLVLTGIEQMLRNYLLYEKQDVEVKSANGIPTTLLGLERRVQFEMQVNHKGEKITVHLGGTSDRIDREGNVVRVIDYKTGKVEPKNLKLNELLEISESPEKEKSLQLLLYMLAWKTQSPDVEIVPGILALKKPSEGLLSISFADKRELSEVNREEIEEAFSVLVNRILDQNEPFRQTDDLKQCAYCSFTGVCNR